MSIVKNYRRKAVNVEVIHWVKGSSVTELRDFILGADEKAKIVLRPDDSITINSGVRILHVSLNDYLVKEYDMKGKLVLNVYKEDSFNELYYLLTPVKDIDRNDNMDAARYGLEANTSPINAELAKGVNMVEGANEIAEGFKRLGRAATVNSKDAAPTLDEAIEKSSKVANNKPSSGITPRHIWKERALEDRLNGLNEAIVSRVNTVGYVNPQWIEERNELLAELNKIDDSNISIGDKVEIVDAMDISLIGSVSKVVAVLGANPRFYRLNTNNNHWLRSQLKKIND